MDKEFELIKNNLIELDSLKLEQSKNDYSKKILKRFKKIASDEEFFNCFSHIIDYLFNNGKVVTNKNILQLSYKRKNHIYILKIVLLKNNAMIKLLSKDEKQQKEMYGYVINLETGKNLMLIEKEIKNYEQLPEMICDITESINISQFDLLGFEVFNYTKKSNENFYLDSITNSKNVSVFKNFTEEEWRYAVENDYIISQNKKEYNYPSEVKKELNIEDSLYSLIGKNISPTSIRLPQCGEFYEFDYQLFEKYFNGDCSIEDMLSDVRSKKYTK